MKKFAKLLSVIVLTLSVVTLVACGSVSQKYADKVNSAAKEKKLKGYICSINKIKYISIEERLPEEESIAQVRAAFATAHVYIDSSAAKDLEYIRKWFIRWKQQP